MPSFFVRAIRTEIHFVEAYIRASSRDQAETHFYAALWDEDAGAVLHWDQQFDSSETDIEMIDEVDRNHPVMPLGMGDWTMCGACGGTVLYEDAEGVWMHTDEGALGDGVGL